MRTAQYCPGGLLRAGSWSRTSGGAEVHQLCDITSKLPSEPNGTGTTTSGSHLAAPQPGSTRRG